MDATIDLDGIVAIDTHVHVEQDGHGHTALDAELLDAAAAYFKTSENRLPTVAYLAERYRASKMAAVIFTVDATTALGHPAISSEEIADEAAAYPDVLIPFGSVDPLGQGAIERVRRLVADHGVRGFKFHPSVQGFDPSDQRFYPLWAAIEETGLPAIFHTGQTGIGAGLPGGRGIKLRYSDPMLLDDVAADFPGLSIVLAHPSVPWQDEAISMATHKANIYIDLSGWSPKYFPAPLVRAMQSFLRHKVLFGSDFPLITPERWIEDFATLEVRPDVVPLIMKENAIGLLGLAGARG